MLSVVVLTVVVLVFVSPASAGSLKGEASWKKVSGAVKYNLYYKEKGDKGYTFAVGNLPSSSTKLTLTNLKDYVKYLYNVAAVDSSGKEYSWSGEKRLFKSF